MTASPIYDISSASHSAQSERFTKQILKQHAYAGKPLSFEQAYQVGSLMVHACRSACRERVTHTFAILCALNNPATLNHPDAPAMIAGISAAVLEEDIGASPLGFVRPKVHSVFENCGMGGDEVVTANVSCLAALTAAAAGITVCKHGSPSNSDEGRCGSSDFLDAIGIELAPSKSSLEACVAQLRFGYVEALDTRYKSIHTQTHHFIRLPHMNHLLGPLTSPVDPTLLHHRIMGVNAHIEPDTIAKTFHILNERGLTNLRHGYFIRGYGDRERTRCMDEVSICAGGTHVVELQGGDRRSFDLSADAFGIETVSEESIGPPAGMTKKEFSMRILQGDIDGPPVQMVCANAGLLLHLADPKTSLRDCYREALKTFHRGGAQDVANAVRVSLTRDPSSL